MSINKYAVKNALRFIPTKLYILLHYFLKMGYFPNLSSPRTFNEKIQWMKLNYHNPLLTDLVDKWNVRDYVARVIGEKYLVKTYGLYGTVEEFLDAELPNEYVVKCTHDSQSAHIVKCDSPLVRARMAKRLKESMSRNWFWQAREWAYKDCKPRIIVEQLLKEPGRETPNDYKYYCFNGKCKFIQCDIDRFRDHREQFFTSDWKSLGDWNSPNLIEEQMPLPASHNLMLELSENLSSSFPHVRVDWYCIEGKPYFGELTFYTGGGFDPFYRSQVGRRDDLDLKLGGYFKLPLKWR